MSESKHWPAPWKVMRRPKQGCDEWTVQIVDANGKVIACNEGYYPTQLSDENADVIAAAPDLLAALKNLVSEIRAYQGVECDDEGAPGAAELKAADIAIAKAEGTTCIS